MKAIAVGLEAVAIRLEAIATRVEAIAITVDFSPFQIIFLDPFGLVFSVSPPTLTEGKFHACQAVPHSKAPTRKLDGSH